MKFLLLPGNLTVLARVRVAHGQEIAKHSKTTKCETRYKLLISEL